ncbi:MAG: hydrolase or metal-binding protein, partial [Acinetobacter sp.]
RLSYYHAASDGLLSCLPLQLILRGKSTTQSYRTPVYYVDLTLRDGISLQDAIISAKEIDQQSKDAGFNQDALDQMARQSYDNAQFDVDGEEEVEIVEEFYSGSESVEEQKAVGVKQADGFIQDIQQGLQRSVRAEN